MDVARDIGHGEMVEAELDSLIRRRHDQRRESGEQQRIEDAWAESVRAHNARRDAELRAAWCGYHQDQAARHRATLEALITHHEEAAARLMENGHREEGA